MKHEPRDRMLGALFGAAVGLCGAVSVAFLWAIARGGGWGAAGAACVVVGAVVGAVRGARL